MLFISNLRLKVIETFDISLNGFLHYFISYFFFVHFNSPNIDSRSWLNVFPILKIITFSTSKYFHSVMSKDRYICDHILLIVYHCQIVITKLIKNINLYQNLDQSSAPVEMSMSHPLQESKRYQTTQSNLAFLRICIFARSSNSYRTFLIFVSYFLSTHNSVINGHFNKNYFKWVKNTAKVQKKYRKLVMILWLRKRRIFIENRGNGSHFKFIFHRSIFKSRGIMGGQKKWNKN